MQTGGDLIGQPRVISDSWTMTGMRFSHPPKQQARKQTAFGKDNLRLYFRIKCTDCPMPAITRKGSVRFLMSRYLPQFAGLYTVIGNIGNIGYQLFSIPFGADIMDFPSLFFQPGIRAIFDNMTGGSLR